LRRYVERFRFLAITSEDFVAFARAELPGVFDRIDADEWLYGEGIPASAPVPHSARLDRLLALGEAIPDVDAVREWSPTEWQLYLESLPHPSTTEVCAELDKRFKLTRSSNYEVLVAWLELAAQSNYEPALPRIEDVLARVGRI